MNFGKMEIVNCLAAVRGYRSFLEISTGTTGLQYSGVNSNLFTTINRLSYNVTDDFDDGAPIDFRSTSLNISACVEDIESRGLRYDIVFVDPYHDYSSSYRDLEVAYHLLKDGGAIVVHDCLPPHGGELIAPEFVSGSWCGVTFIAYVDFLLANDVSFETVDCDYGCGIFYKTSDGRRHDQAAREAWLSARKDPELALQSLHRNSRELLGLVPPNHFLNSILEQCSARRLSADDLADASASIQSKYGLLSRVIDVISGTSSKRVT